VFGEKQNCRIRSKYLVGTEQGQTGKRNLTSPLLGHALAPQDKRRNVLAPSVLRARLDVTSKSSAGAKQQESSL